MRSSRLPSAAGGVAVVMGATAAMKILKSRLEGIAAELPPAANCSIPDARARSKRPHREPRHRRSHYRLMLGARLVERRNRLARRKFRPLFRPRVPRRGAP